MGLLVALLDPLSLCDATPSPTILPSPIPTPIPSPLPTSLPEGGMAPDDDDTDDDTDEKKVIIGAVSLVVVVIVVVIVIVWYHESRRRRKYARHGSGIKRWGAADRGVHSPDYGITTFFPENVLPLPRQSSDLSEPDLGAPEDVPEEKIVVDDRDVEYSCMSGMGTIECSNLFSE